MYKETNYNQGKIMLKDGTIQHIKYKTEIETLDVALDGGITNGIATIGAMPGYGKSMLAVQIAFSLCKKGMHAYIYSNEMLDVDYWERLQRLEKRIGAASDEVSGRFNVLDISEEGEIDNLIQDIKEKKKVTPNMVVVLDYLQRFSGEKRDTDIRLYTDVCLRKLENIAYRLEIPIIVLSTLNGVRDSKNKISLASFKETNEIGHASDIVIAIESERKNMGDKVVYEFTILKNKKGIMPPDSIKLCCYPQDSFFTDVNKKHTSLPFEDVNGVDVPFQLGKQNY